MSNPTHIVLVLFDGLRPDLITTQRMPHLAEFIASGTQYVDSHCVFPPSTRVNAAALSAGAYPNATGIVANKMYDPAVFIDHVMHTGKFEHIARAEAAHNGRFVTAAGLGDVLADSGMEMAVICSGSAGTTRMANPRAPQNRQVSLCLRDWRASSPNDFATVIYDRFGPIAEPEFPSSARMEQQTTMFLEGVFPARRPHVSLIWYTEPDWTQHAKGLGSAEANAALAVLDRQFKRILDWRTSIAAQSDIQIMVLSDHGHITARHKIDLKNAFDTAGFYHSKVVDDRQPFVASLDNIGTVWVKDRAQAILPSIVTWLLAQPWSGLVFTRKGDGVRGFLPGTFHSALLMNNHNRSPDLFFTLYSSPEKNSAGIAGSGYFSSSTIAQGGAFHGGLNYYEMKTLLAMSGSRFRSRTVFDCPAGITDIAPTVLKMLGLKPCPSMTGRVLAEAFRQGDLSPVAPYYRKNEIAMGSGKGIVHMREFDDNHYIVGGEGRYAR